MDEAIDAKERFIPWADDDPTSRAAKLHHSTLMDLLENDLLQEMELYRPPALPEPEVRFGQSESTSEIPLSRDSGISPLEGYTSEAENIKFYLKRRTRLGEEYRPVELSKQYLRDTCQCSKCVCPSSGRKTFATCDVPTVPQLLDPGTESIRLHTDGSLEITWEDDFLTGDRHISVYPRDFLERLFHNDGITNYESRPRRLLWDKAVFQHSLRQGMESWYITYDGWMEGGTEFADAVLNLFRRGLLFIGGVPKSRNSVQRIAEKMGILQSTIRGLTWDVISQPGAENVAGNNRRLGLHQDLLYCQTPPRIKLLHCLENECEGGVSLFSDGLHAASQLGTQSWTDSHVLETQHVTYWYQRAGHYLESRRRVIESGPHGSIQSIAWSPAFQGPFRVGQHLKTLNLPEFRGKPRETGPATGALRAWSRAARAFRDILESPGNVVQHRLEPGDCVVFDNKRILHGRTEVDASAGLRHLRGAYVNGQTLHSTFVNLRKKNLMTHGRFSSAYYEPGIQYYPGGIGNMGLNDLSPWSGPGA